MLVSHGGLLLRIITLLRGSSVCLILMLDFDIPDAAMDFTRLLGVLRLRLSIALRRILSLRLLSSVVLIIVSIVLRKDGCCAHGQDLRASIPEVRRAAGDKSDGCEKLLTALVRHCERVRGCEIVCRARITRMVFSVVADDAHLYVDVIRKAIDVFKQR